jgi:hypothetical protein
LAKYGLSRRAALLAPIPGPLYEGGPCVKRGFVVGDLRVDARFELGSSLYGALAGDELGGSCSGSALQFGTVMRPGTRRRLPEQRARSW